MKSILGKNPGRGSKKTHNTKAKKPLSCQRICVINCYLDHMRKRFFFHEEGKAGASFSSLYL